MLHLILKKLIDMSIGVKELEQFLDDLHGQGFVSWRSLPLPLLTGSELSISLDWAEEEEDEDCSW